MPIEMASYALANGTNFADDWQPSNGARGTPLGGNDSQSF